jgi:uncharacterized membrane protein YgcG
MLALFLVMIGLVCVAVLAGFVLRAVFRAFAGSQSDRSDLYTNSYTTPRREETYIPVVPVFIPTSRVDDTPSYTPSVDTTPSYSSPDPTPSYSSPSYDSGSSTDFGGGGGGDFGGGSFGGGGSSDSY